MKTKITILAMASAAMVLTASADRGKPGFAAGIWADGETYGSKRTTELPPPNAHNMHSYDPLFVIINSNNPEGQLAVAEAGLGNPAFNGGRWITYTAWWTDAGFDEFDVVPVVTSYAELMAYYDDGYLDFEIGSPPDGPPEYFQCPLLPVKE